MDMKRTILIIDDDESICRLLSQSLSRRYTCLEAHTGEEGMKIVHDEEVHLILLDLNLPDIHGTQMCHILRSNISAPIIVVTGDTRITILVALLQAGADDYVTKPFDFHELNARVDAHIRRFVGTMNKRVYRLGRLLLNSTDRTARIDEEIVTLRPKEFELLELFAQHNGITLPRSALLQRLWPDIEPTNNALEVHVKNLRDRLAPLGDPSPISTIYGLGYRFNILS